MTHSPEPWTKLSTTEIQSAIYKNGSRKGRTAFVANCYSDDLNDNQMYANRDRIVACVNACRGIETEVLIKKADALQELFAFRLVRET